MSHSHSHPHVHTHVEHTSNIAQANRVYFDQHASQYDLFPGAFDLARNCAQEILKAYPFKEGETVVMEFACGTGLVSKELIHHVKSILGVDISQGQVDQYNKKVQNEGIPLEKMHAVRCELEGKEGELNGLKFDVIFCTSAYHHFESIDKVTSTLAYFLKPGGALIVIDGERGQNDIPVDEAHRKIVAHANWLEKADIVHALEQAGLSSISYETVFSTELFGFPVSYFVAKGIKPL